MRQTRRETLRVALFDAQRRNCWICGREMALRGDPNHPHFATFDELTPQSAGGKRHRSNQLLAHRGCNGARGNAPLTSAQLARVQQIRCEIAGVVR